MLIARSAMALILLLTPLAFIGPEAKQPSEPSPKAPPPAARAPQKVPAAAGLLGEVPPFEARPPAEPNVKPLTPLVVVVSIDQFAYEYLPRFKHGFSDEGFFRRVDREGANYPNCHHRHAFTVTAPGHAVQLTGTYPAKHGIIGNNWYERTTAKPKVIYCMDDNDFPLVGRPEDLGPGTTASGASKPAGVSAKRLLVPTIGEELQKQRAGAKLCGVALKDRAAVLMCGHKADTIVWFDETTGNWVTSTCYDSELPDYVAAYNHGRAVRKYAGTTWNLLKPIEEYKLYYPDDAKFEGEGYGLGRDFPHVISATAKNYFTQVALTPFGNDLTLDMVREVLTHEQLGKDETPDLLCINLSSPDYCGHNYGPHSLEVEDMYYRIDLQLAQLTTWLDEIAGQDRWTMIITADHGVVPIAEYAKSINLPGDRNALRGTESLRQQLNKFLAQRFGPAATERGPIVAMDESQLFLNPAEPLIRDRREEVEDLLVGFLAKHEAIETVMTKRQILSGVSNGSKFYDAFRRAVHPTISGDVLWCLKPYRYQSTTPATHGSVWPYDTHVPLLLLGKGIKPGVYQRPTSPAAIAATVARLLGVEPPATCIERGAEEAVGQ